MAEIIFSRDLVRQGYTADDISRMVRTGQLARVRRGAFHDPLSAGEGDQATTSTIHQRLVAATIGQCGPEAIVSHHSAAALHGLPVWPAELHQVALTRNRSGGGATRRFVQLHGHPIAADEVTSVAGVPVTTLARTVLDLACTYPMDKAVAVGDRALQLGLSTAELERCLKNAGPRHGIAVARRSIAFLDWRSGSVGESQSRVMLHQQGVPKSNLQFKVHDPYGRIIAATDFAWEDLRTVGEFDGRLKYQRSLRPGHDPELELFKEKQREDKIRDAGWEVVRWTYADIDRPAELLSRLRRAFDRGCRAG